MIINKNMSEQLDNYLQKYKKVYVISNKEDSEWFYQCINKANEKNDILILSCDEFSDIENIDWVKMSENQMNDIMELYLLYEFSDRLVVIGENTQYGSLSNYVRTGLMTYREVFDVLMK